VLWVGWTDVGVLSSVKMIMEVWVPSMHRGFVNRVNICW